MANSLTFDAQCHAVHLLAEGMSLRSVEQVTGFHRDTVMRLGARVGRGCAMLHDEVMRDLPCTEIQIDEGWSYVGAKQKNVTHEEDAMGFGDRWVYGAVCPQSGVTVAYMIGKRDFTTTYRFGHDLAGRVPKCKQITSDGNNEYISVIIDAFGPDMAYAQLVKTYVHEEQALGERKFSPPPMTKARRRLVSGEPDEKKIKTTAIEARWTGMRNLTKRIARLTICYSKVTQNFDSAIALNVAYTNFVRPRTTDRLTPAGRLGIQKHRWRIKDLVRAALERCPQTQDTSND